MDERRVMAQRVLEGGWSVSRAAREFGVSRLAARKWVRRAREVGLAALAEESRRPHTIPRCSGQETVDEFLALKAKYPGFGAKKLVALMENPLSVRTGNRLLAKAGLAGRERTSKADLQCFERTDANALWQMDFKRLGWRSEHYEVLSVIDDATRFNIGLEGLSEQRLSLLQPVLWDLFGTYGLPAVILTDNGSVFNNSGTWRLSSFDAWLLKLGVLSIHGRPNHPQTQGKVERFHGTLESDKGQVLRAVNLGQAKPILSTYRDFYNWERPHEAIGQKLPGSVYTPSSRKRPDFVPEHHIPEGASSRKVDDEGWISYKGERYKMGRGLAGEHVQIAGADPLNPTVLFYGYELRKLSDYRRERW